MEGEENAMNMGNAGLSTLLFFLYKILKIWLWRKRSIGRLLIVLAQSFPKYIQPRALPLYPKSVLLTLSVAKDHF